MAREDLNACQVLAGHVLGEREVEPLPVLRVADHCRDQVELGQPRRAQAALPGHELVAASGQRADHDGLEHSACAYRLGQLLQRDGVEVLARLVRVWLDQLERDLAQSLAPALTAREDGRQAAAHAAALARARGAGLAPLLAAGFGRRRSRASRAPSAQPRAATSLASFR